MRVCIGRSLLLLFDPPGNPLYLPARMTLTDGSWSPAPPSASVVLMAPERASTNQVADIRRHALRALHRLVVSWSAMQRSEVELADAMPGLLADLEAEMGQFV